MDESLDKKETTEQLPNSGTIFFAMNLVDRERSDVLATEDGFLIKKLDNFAIVPLEKYEELVPTVRGILKKSARQKAHRRFES